MRSTLLLLISAILAFAGNVPERGGEGQIVINSDPEGSQVYLDGEELGDTPVNTSFRSGRWDLLIMDGEVELINTRFNVWPDSVNVFEKKTKIPFGNIAVSTKRNCKVYLDGEMVEYIERNTTLTMKRIDAGTHTIQAICGKKKFEQIIELEPEGEVEVKFTK